MDTLTLFRQHRKDSESERRTSEIVKGDLSHRVWHSNMAFMLKAMMGSSMKNLGNNLGGEAEVKENPDGKETAESKGMTREEFEEYQRQLVEEKIERDHAFAHKKAERAAVRMHMRDKYRLPQSEKDDAQLQMVGGEVELPEDLAKMVQEDEEEEEEQDSLLSMLPEFDIDALKVRAQGTYTEVRRVAEEKCVLM
ncbi:provisional ortholog of complexin 4 L homeolog isoform X3 [Xenopus laevis]|uniref:Provisional ortholog of complexin 4 L homeolog isoform X3 n=1 Tax=Xenopus laevis TaxID=8355 RepID=A0A8J1M6K3_XENLA|nr:provisional ortholog of complexin 4 L homeolog isoform X3 [Xenopus laevis]